MAHIRITLQQGSDAPDTSGQLDRLERAIVQLGWLGQRQLMQLLADPRFDLTLPQFYTLQHLQLCDGTCSMSDLARGTQQSAATLTGVVDRLREKRLVARARSRADRRQVMVTVTDGGRAVLQAVRQARQAETRRVLGHLPADTLDDLLRALDRAIDGMLLAGSREPGE